MDSTDLDNVCNGSLRAENKFVWNDKCVALGAQMLDEKEKMKMEGKIRLDLC